MRRRSVIPALAALCTGLAGVAVAVAPGSATAASVACTAPESAIYTPPASVAAAPGTVLACRPTGLPEVPGDIAMKAWRVQYASRVVPGRRGGVSGLGGGPTAPWTGPGARPVVSYHFGTLGLGSQCAFSKQLAGAYQDEYEGDQVAGLLRAGWAVAATDDVGYLTGRTHTYMAGHNAAHAMLDVVRAAFQVPGSGLSTGAKVGVWGYSQGGAASLWSAQLAATYAPELNLAGAAAGGVPADLKEVAKASDGGAFAGFSVDATIGLHAAYPNLPFDALMNEQGRRLIADLKTLCLVGTVARGAGARSESLTTGGLSPEEFYRLAGPDGVTWGAVLDAQKLGVGVGTAASGARYRIGFPVLQYHGLLDEVIPTQVEEAVRTAYCRAGITTRQRKYLTGHLLADGQAIGDVVAWFTDRFAGRPATGNC
ncbi:lipase family protein [Actinoplanes sp. NEAU-A12]|uniref:Lipase family protein n=1 Tax=Actinoplanes sandaracinus TaxID=3045177 RepID=A0ABT6WXV6_9ACTN|nr:lipase family protein [Actinoplanes sandaracinus]MDI6104573.1 lipase family protein [Actinoplanes sandaracinus]